MMHIDICFDILGTIDGLQPISCKWQTSWQPFLLTKQKKLIRNILLMSTNVAVITSSENQELYYSLTLYKELFGKC